MAKRQAAYQLTQDSAGRDDDDMDTPSFNSNPEEIARRPMKGLPKRGGRITQTSPQKSLDQSSSTLFGEATFANPTFPSSFPPTSQPPQVPSFSFQPPTATTQTAPIPPSFPSFQPPKSNLATTHNAPANKENDNLFKFYSSMRGLNNSLLEVIRTEVDSDPFVNLEKVLGAALENYSRHHKDIQSTLDTVMTKPTLAPPPPTGGFSFGGKSLPVSPSGSGASLPALNPTAPTFTPLGASGIPSFPKFEPPSFPKFTPPNSGAKTISTDESERLLSDSKPVESNTPKAAPPSVPFSGFGSKPADIPHPDTSRSKPSRSEDEPKETPKPPVFGTSSFSTSGSTFGSGSAFGGFPTSSASGINVDSTDKTVKKSSDEAPKSTFGGSFGKPAAPPAFGGFGASVAPPSGSIGNPVGFSFGSNFGQAKKDEAAAPSAPSTTSAFGSSAFGTSTTTGVTAFGSGSTSAFGSAKSAFGTSNSASTFGSSSTFGTGGKSAFGTGNSVFGSGGTFGSSTDSEAKPTSGDSAGTGLVTPASSFGSTTSFGGFGAPGSSTFGSQPASSWAGTSAPTPKTGESTQEGETDTPAAAFEFTSTEIEGAGEEDETSVYSVRGKLLKLDDGKWVALGLGHFKIKKHKETGKQRVLFRTEGNGHVVANYNIFPGMQLVKQPKLLRFPGMQDSQLVPFGLQLKLPNMVDEAHDALLKASEEANVA